MPGVIGSTFAEAKAHPWIVGGGLAALVGIMWYASRPSTSTAPGQFNFTYGPSDASIQAGTALSIAQAGNQSALSIAGLNASNQQALATTAAGVQSDYYSYLATAGNTTADTTKSAQAYAYQTAVAADNASVAISAGNNKVATNKDNLASWDATYPNYLRSSLWYSGGADAAAVVK